MQYTQRKLQRSVTEMRRSSSGRPRGSAGGAVLRGGGGGGAPLTADLGEAFAGKPAAPAVGSVETGAVETVSPGPAPGDTETSGVTPADTGPSGPAPSGTSSQTTD